MSQLSLEQLYAGSAYLGRDCPYCKVSLAVDDLVVTCPVDATVMHGLCWQENSNKCAAFGCSGRGEVFIPPANEPDIEWATETPYAQFTANTKSAPVYGTPASMGTTAAGSVATGPTQSNRPGVSSLGLIVVLVFVLAVAGALVLSLWSRRDPTIVVVTAPAPAALAGQTAEQEAELDETVVAPAQSEPAMPTVADCAKAFGPATDGYRWQVTLDGECSRVAVVHEAAEVVDQPTDPPASSTNHGTGTSNAGGSTNDNPSLEPVFCPGAFPTRLAVGDTARVVNYQLNVRSGPSTSSSIEYRLDPGRTVEILDGPQCDDGQLWYYVRSELIRPRNGSQPYEAVGWLVEESGEEWFLEPVR